MWIKSVTHLERLGPILNTLGILEVDQREGAFLSHGGAQDAQEGQQRRAKPEQQAGRQNYFSLIIANLCFGMFCSLLCAVKGVTAIIAHVFITCQNRSKSGYKLIPNGPNVEPHFCKIEPNRFQKRIWASPGALHATETAPRRNVMRS